MPFAIQPSIEELQRSKRGSVESILDAAIGGYNAYTQARESKAKRQKDKLDYYTSLRDAGYSPADAAKRSDQTFGGGMRIPGKTGAELKTAAETRKLTAEAKEIEEGRETPTQAKLTRAKNNALNFIKRKARDFDRSELIDEMLDEFDVDVSDPDIRAALDEAYAEREGPGLFSRGMGVLSRIMGGVLDQAGRTKAPAKAKAPAPARRPSPEEALAELKRRGRVR